MAMARTKRFGLNPTILDKDWDFTALDRAILTLLTRYKYISGVFFHAYFPDHTPNGINRALNKLRHKGLLVKPEWQRKGWNTLNDSDICTILPLGYEYLGLPVPEKYRDPKYPTAQLHHTKSADDTMLSAEIAIRQAGRTFVTEEEITATSKFKDPLCFQFDISHTFKDGHSEHLSSVLKPDHWWADRGEGGKSRFYLLELENGDPVYRSTLGKVAVKHKKTGEYTHGGNSSSLRKMLAYTDIHKEGRVWSQLRKHGFTVIFAYTNETHYLRAQKLAHELFGDNTELFRFVLVPAQHVTGKSTKPYPEQFTDILKDPTA